MRFVPYEAGIQALFHSEDGPIGIFLARKGNAVHQRAYAHASGAGTGPGVRSRDLLLHLRFGGIVQTQDGMRALIGSDAEHRGYNYPYALETGRHPETGEATSHGTFPFLMPAIREEFQGFF